MRARGSYLHGLRHVVSCSACGSIVVLFNSYKGGALDCPDIEMVLAWASPDHVGAKACVWCGVPTRAHADQFRWVQL